MPLGPIMLDLQGFYQPPLNKSLWCSFLQILRAMLGCIIAVSSCSLFLRSPLQNRTVPLLFITIATIGLLTKERFSALFLYIRRRAGHGGLESGFCSREHHKLLPRSSSRFPPRKNPGRGGRSDRHRQTPGLTCPWQISSRNQVRDFRDRVRRDLVISTAAHHRITS